MGKISQTWALMQASWDLLKQDTEMLFFPLLSGLSCLLVLISFALPLVVSGQFSIETDFAQPLYYLLLFGFYLANYCVITFFNSALVACALIRMQGGNPILADGFKGSMERLPLIIGWSLLAATVGFVLRIIEERSEFVGRMVAGVLGMAWTMTSFLAVPILVIERKGPLDALKDSAHLLKRTWGEQVVSNFSFGLVFFLLALPAVVPLFLGLMSGNIVGITIGVGLAIVYWILLSLIQSALQVIFQTALYLHVKEGPEPQGFPVHLLDRSVT